MTVVQHLICRVTFAAFALPSLALAGEWVYPLDVASRDGQLVVADRNWPGVWQTKNGELSELFAASKKFRTPMNAVRCVAFGAEGQVYAGDSATRQVYRLDDDGPKKLAGDGVGIGIPMDLAVAPDGSIYVSDIELHRIVRLPAEGGEPEDVVSIRAPRGVLWDGDSLIVVTHGENNLVRVTPDGKATPFVEGQPFNFPHEIAKLGDTYYVTDGYADGIWPVSSDGTVGELIKADGMTNPVGITPHNDGLLIVDPRASSFYQLAVDESGKATIVATTVAEAAGSTSSNPQKSPPKAPRATNRPRAQRSL